MGFAGSVVKFGLINIPWLIIWALGSYVLASIYSFADPLISSVSPEWTGWKVWLIYIWNYSPIIVAIGSAFWIIARSQEKDVAMYPYS